MGTRQKAWGAAHTLDSGPPARPPAPSPSTSRFTWPTSNVFCMFFWKKTEFILNIFVYLTGRGEGGCCVGAGPAAWYSACGDTREGPPPSALPLCTVLWRRNTHFVSKVYFKMCLCVCLTFY